MEGKKPFSFTKWAKSRKGQQVIICVAFMTIPLLLLFVFTYLPFAEMVKFSFYKMKYLTPVDQRKFVGFKNYIDVFRRDDCFGALKLSLYYMVGAIIQLVLALYLATILSFKVKGGNFFKGLMFFPYLISGIAIGFIFKFFYTRGFVLDTILQWCGFKLDNLPYWLKDQSINNWSLVATSVWRYFGQNMVLFIGAIMSVDADLYEAAELDGASRWQSIRNITLPGLKPSLITMTLLSVGKIFYSDFGLFYQVPQNSGALYSVTDTVDTYVYRALMSSGGIGRSSAAGVIQSVVGFILVIASNAIVNKISKENALF